MGGLKTIHARDGTPITDIKAAVVRSSLLNDIGEAIFQIPTSSIKCRREVLEFGNYLYVQNDKMPDWVGIIDTPRTWRSGAVEVHAYEVPFILNYRITPLNSTINGTPGELVNQLIGIANGDEDTLIRPGSIFAGGVSAPEVLTDTVYAHIKGIQSYSNHDWICTPVIGNNGMLTIQLDWVEKSGVVTDIELSQGKNILYGDTPLDEAGELLNFVHALTDQQGENPETLTQTDAVSRARYGLRAARRDYITATASGSLITSANALLMRQKDPDISTPLTVVDKGSVFKSVRLGNIMKYKYTNVGFDNDGLGWSDYVRIMGYRFDEAANTVELFTGKII
jgi:hypothetical protein